MNRRAQCLDCPSMRRPTVRTALIAAAVAVAAGAGAYGSQGSEPVRTAIALAPITEPRVGAAPGVPARPPVVMLVLDEFPAGHLLGPDGRVDPGRFPGFAELAATGTWFPNAHTVYDATVRAVPAILDAQLPEPGTAPTFEDHPRSVYDLFARQGYEIVGSEEASSVCPPRHCRGARAEAPPVLSLLRAGRPARLHRFFRTIRPRRGRPTFYLKHVLLPHGPHVYLPSGKRSRRRSGEQLPGLETLPGFGDRSATHYNVQRQLLQIGYVDRELQRLVRRMKRLGMFDRSLIVVTADHGFSSEVSVPSRRKTTRANIDEVAPVPLFLKAPRQRRGRVNPAYARTVDVVPTMADILGFAMPYRADGRSAFSRAVRRRRVVEVIARDFSGTVSIGARALERRRRVLLRRRLRLFGSGDWASLHTGTGPNRQLLGRSLADLSSAHAGRSRAAGTVFDANDLRRVRPRSAVVPTQVTGEVEGKSQRNRDIAVSVNGKVEAVSRTFRLFGSTRELFAVNVPERSLRPGRNDVLVFEVLRGGRTLRLLAGA